MNMERLTELTIKKFDGTLSSAEKTELDSYEANASPEDLAAYHAMENEHSTVEALRVMMSARRRKEANRSRLRYPCDDVTRMPNRGVRSVPNVRRYIAIAAVLFALVVGAVLWKNMMPHKATTVAQGGLDGLEAVKPIGNKAVLVLADGRTIALDSAATGSLAMQGDVRVTKDREGKISYQPLSNMAAVGFNTVNTPRGGEYYVELPDRTKVWLNAASSIRFPTAFTGADRSVTITGEAYLEVAKDKAHPFIVNLGETSVRVLGTHFNVKNYAEDGPATTTLLEGSVRVTNGLKQALLKPGQQASSEKGVVNVNPRADTSAAIAWKNGYLNFNKADITTIMNTVQRWYDVTVEFEGARSAYKLGGEIPKNTSLKDVLTMLHDAGYRFNVQGKTIHMLP